MASFENRYCLIFVIFVDVTVVVVISVADIVVNVEDCNLLEEHVLGDESGNVNDLTVQWEAHSALVEDTVSVANIFVHVVVVVDHNSIAISPVSVSIVAIVVSVTAFIAMIYHVVEVVRVRIWVRVWVRVSVTVSIAMIYHVVEVVRVVWLVGVRVRIWVRVWVRVGIWVGVRVWIRVRVWVSIIVVVIIVVIIVVESTSVHVVVVVDIVIVSVEVWNNNEQGVILTSDSTLWQKKTMWESTVVVVGVKVQVVQVVSILVVAIVLDVVQGSAVDYAHWLSVSNNVFEVAWVSLDDVVSLVQFNDELVKFNKVVAVII